MVEYALEIDLPDFIFEDPIIRAMSDATTDIMTWPNVRSKRIYLFCTPAPY